MSKENITEFRIEHRDEDGYLYSMQIQECHSLVDYQIFAMALAIYPEDANLIYPALKLNGEAGAVAEKIGKLMRDKPDWVFNENGRFTADEMQDEDRVALLKELGDVLWYVTACAKDLGYDLEDVAKMNLYKLYKRKEAGTLQGSGDDR